MAGTNPLGLFIEPLIVISLLTGGVYFNRRPQERGHTPLLPSSPVKPASSLAAANASPASFSNDEERAPNPLRLSPLDTSRYASSWISRLVYKYPFILEVLYWALTYWVYQIARAISAVLFIDAGTIDTARAHGIQLIEFERKFGFQWENAIQEYIMNRSWAITALNRIYSFIHIPATILFLSYFYHTQPTRVYAPTRRTLALANLLAFVVFTLWPAMPPRLLPASYGFVDTVHAGNMSSVWTTNRFCNQYAAMPSLHFGYSFLVGWSLFAHAPRTTFRRYGLHTLFLLYPATILLAIVATANHYIIDAVAGFFLAILALNANNVLLALLPLENRVFYLLHLHKPAPAGGSVSAIEWKGEEVLPRFVERNA
ncbi:PAP2 superfamily-domain-containing protein [Amylostereum chailletii]|nr:PAP2 superfamily-domain-containing protein [Amylostereum chailletii]